MEVIDNLGRSCSEAGVLVGMVIQHFKFREQLLHQMLRALHKDYQTTIVLLENVDGYLRELQTAIRNLTNYINTLKQDMEYLKNQNDKLRDKLRETNQ